ncbi:MAG: DNA polymerase/3'-5' exonuclease PolX [Elusimicrobia bacterium]|nr:DNA polymerase/3'-5' exonuclease PolX [Elusimicrobiota bacterium]
MRNNEVAKLLYEISELLSLTEHNPFRIRAYERAAQAVESLTDDIDALSARGKLREVPRIGESIAEKITEYLNTGKIEYFEDLKKLSPKGLIQIMQIPGLGPKKAKIVFDKLHISDIDKLKKAAEEGKLKDLPGFAEKTQANILQGIALKQKTRGRILLHDALALSENIISQLKKIKEVRNISYAGSLRRKLETVGDIDILCTVENNNNSLIIEKFTHLPEVDRIISSGETKASIYTDENIQIDLRVVAPESYGAALQYFTGSKEHNVALRELASKKDLTINEYGVYKVKKKNTSNELIAGKTETEVYNSVGLQYIPPEIRENRGEIEAAKTNSIPGLIREKDILGDIHLHTNYSDGANTVEQVAEKAIELGWEWIIICDHSQSLKIANGASVKDLRKRNDEIHNYNAKYGDVHILCGSEVDILTDGKLDYPDEVLKELDFITASIHTGFKETEEQITGRILRAFENKYVNALSHPTGRIIRKRDSYSISMERVLEGAKKFGVFLEINAFPERLDLTDIYCKKAKEMGIKMTIGSDAHRLDHMEYIPQGVFVAQRGWLEKKDVINTLNYHELIKVLKKRR